MLRIFPEIEEAVIMPDCIIFKQKYRLVGMKAFRAKEIESCSS